MLPFPVRLLPFCCLLRRRRCSVEHHRLLKPLSNYLLPALIPCCSPLHPHVSFQPTHFSVHHLFTRVQTCNTG